MPIRKNRSTTTKKSLRKTVKRTKTSENLKSKIVKTFLEMLNLVKLYHWKTHSYAEHKATDELYDKLNNNVDKFIEVLLGKDQSRIKLVSLRMDLIEAETTKNIKSKVHEYREFLTDMDRILDHKKDSDLLSIRDDILADMNQFLYLLSFH